MDLGQQIAVYFGVALVMWYVGASFYNRRLGVRTYRWLHAGMAGLGKITEAKWIGSSAAGARISVAQAARPFRQVEATFLLETRELLPLWLLNRLRGKRDALFARIQLRSVPRGELEVLPGNDGRLRNLESRSQPDPWTLLDRQLPSGLRAAGRGTGAKLLLDSVEPLLVALGPSVRHLSISRNAPHLILEVALAGLKDEPAESFFAVLTQTFLAGTAGPEA